MTGLDVDPRAGAVGGDVTVGPARLVSLGIQMNSQTFEPAADFLSQPPRFFSDSSGDHQSIQPSQRDHESPDLLADSVNILL